MTATTEREQRLADQRAWLAARGDPPTALDVAQPFIDGLAALADLEECSQSHGRIVDHGMTTFDIGVDDLAAAVSHLQLCHRVSDLIAAEFGSHVPRGSDAAGAAARAVVNQVTGVELLARLLRHYDHEVELRPLRGDDGAAT